MHLMVPFASTLSQGCVHTLRDLQLPNLSRLLARLSPTVREGADEYALSMPHERALATAIGWRGDDGCLPWAARQAAADGVDTGGGESAGNGAQSGNAGRDAGCDVGRDALAWGLLTPVHWHLASDHVALVDPAELALDAVESRALMLAVQGLFEGVGWRIEYGAPTRWYAAHESLRDLPCASIERVIGRDVDIWMPAEPRVARIRGLQSEVQMLLYTDATNAAREARGALPVNSFWLSGCGVRQPEAAAPGLRVDDALRASALAADWADWADAWRALDVGALAELAAHIERGTPAALTLCGERYAQRFEPVARSLWTRATAALRSPPVAPVLEAL